ncbi:MAG: type II secretion system F family protein, partial [Sphaerochaetaceae bacterium]|nr:type II secretion system F family protein [Sphaerochaetaceae bacterium]
SYPIILSTSLLISIVSLFKFVIPKFETIYEKLEGNLPLSTQYLLYIKDLFDNYFGAFLLLCFISTYLFLFMCKKSTAFKENLDRFLLTKIPIVSKMFLVSNSSNFFFCLSTLLNDKYQFYDSLKNSKTLISNTYLYYKITQIEMDIKNGENISNAFDKSKLFDDLTIRLINTGEKSNKLALTVSKIDIIYKKKLDKILQNFITIFEPSIIAIMASLILWLVLAIFTPIWDIGTILK